VAQLPHPDSRPARNPGDGWVECRCGAQHWGLFGAAGLLLAAAEEAVTGPSRTGVPRVLLQHRALWSHHGGTWGIPGGALAPGEAPVDGALREAVEEAGVPDHTVRVWACSVLRHPDWAYTTVVGEATQPFHPHAGDGESLEVAWVRAEDVTDRPLLPAFGAAWAEQARLVGRRLALVVDAANVIGSRPDGWWRDRPGAAARLHGRLAAALPAGLPAGALGLPADRWWPDVHLVLEGRAREAPVPPGPVGPPVPAPAPAVRVIRAPRDGDDEVVAVARAALAPGAYSDVVVVTADRALAARVRADGAGVVGPGALLAAV
jgi:8-oxo-dGTP pyrophosphatase MutT (NUDIX family)